MLLSGCREEIFNDAVGGERVITAVIDDRSPSTRTCVDAATYDNTDFTGIIWSPGDSIGVYSGTSANVMFRNASSTNVKKTDFVGQLSDTPLYAYYPYDSANSGKSPANLIGEVRSEQPYSLISRVLTDDYKVGVPEVGSSSRFTFSHLFSLLKIEIDASGTVAEGEKLDYVHINVKDAAGNPRAIAGRFNFDITSAIPSYSNLSDTKSEILMKWEEMPELSSGKKYIGFVTAIPEVRRGDVIKLTIATDQRLMDFMVECAVDFKSGYVYNFPLILDNYEGREEYGWKENARAKITSFSFTAASNSGKILDRKVVNSGTDYNVEKNTAEIASIEGSDVNIEIPYLYDFKLKPTFTVGEGTRVTCGDRTVISGETEIDFSSGCVEMNVITDNDTHTYRVNVRNSGLPVVVINQSGSGDFSDETSGSLFNKRVRNQFLDFKIRKKNSEWVSDDVITVYNPDGTENLSSAKGGVRQRGNSTKKYPKKALAIKLASKNAILGMPSSKRWVLLANWIDHSVIRNAAAFALANLIKTGVEAENLEPGIPWQPSGRNVELVIDGRHVGNYLLAEQIKVEKKRLNINDSFEDRLKDGKSTAFTDCGYLLEFDQSYDEPWKFRTSRSNIPVQIKDDVIGGDAVGKALWQQVQDKINAVETNLLNGNYAEAYKDYDIYSAIDQWLIYELTQNREYTEPRSVYYFINGGGKLTAGPVWDFDRGTFHNPTKAKEMGNESNRIKPYNQWLSELSTGDSGTTPGVWYRVLVKDPVFTAAVKARWKKLLPHLELLPGEIRMLGEENRISWKYNNAMWPTTKAVRKAGNDNSDFKDWSGDEWLSTYDEVIENMIECYVNRLTAMDALINKL